MYKTSRITTKSIGTLIDGGFIVMMAALSFGESGLALAAVRTETLLVGASAVLATFLLGFTDRDLSDARMRAARYLLRTLAMWIMAQGCVFVLMVALKGASLPELRWLLRWTVLVALALAASRIVFFVWHRHGLCASNASRAIAIVGRDERIAQLAVRVSGAASSYRLVACFKTTSENEAAEVANCGQVLCDLPSFAQFSRQQRVEEIWIALPFHDESTISAVIDEFRADFIDLRLLPDLSQHALFGCQVDEILGEPTIALAASPLPLRSRLLKSIFDRLFAGAVLISLMALLLVIAVAVKLSSPGPVLFRQQRRGADGRIFTIYKFRSMRLHAEQQGTLVQATRSDRRVTKVGAFLRRTSLDELPQFFNVLLGDMSVVGPRPHALEHDAQYRTLVEGYTHRYRIKPGITGWAQVNGLRGETRHVESMQSRIECDLYYLRNWSFALDLRIIWGTLLKGITHPNAY